MAKQNFYIEVKETLKRIVRVEAESLEEAMERVEEWANEGDGLSYEDFVNRDFEDRTEECKERESLYGDCVNMGFFWDLPEEYYLDEED